MLHHDRRLRREERARLGLLAFGERVREWTAALPAGMGDEVAFFASKPTVEYLDALALWRDGLITESMVWGAGAKALRTWRMGADIAAATVPDPAPVGAAP